MKAPTLTGVIESYAARVEQSTAAVNKLLEGT